MTVVESTVVGLSDRGEVASLGGTVNEHFLARYRALLDAEDAAFDELEHAYEDGDREQFVTDLTSWQDTVARRISYLERSGLTREATATA